MAGFLNLPLIQVVGFENTTAQKSLSACFIGHKKGNSYTIKLEPLWLTGAFTVGLLFLILPTYTGLSTLLIHASQREKYRWKYISVYPYVICEKHLFKPEKVRKKFVYCDVLCRGKDCSQEFKTGIKEIVGLISDDVKQHRIDGDKVYVNLWSEMDKKARNADIDVLEIRNLPGISYDYAINAVLVTLKNDVSRPRNYVKGIPVVLVGNPPIPDGAMKILRYEFKSVEIRGG